VEKIVSTIQRMVKAAFTFPDDEETPDDGADAVSESEDTGENDDEESEEAEAKEPPKAEAKTPSSKKASPATQFSDFGTYLASAYGIKDERGSDGASVLGGSFVTAMQEARAQARLLVVFLPVEKPGKKSSGSNDAIAIESILSEEVGKAANKKARSKGEDTGSFLFWGAKVGSSEATSATKALKVKRRPGKGGKKPALMIVYPGMVSAECITIYEFAH